MLAEQSKLARALLGWGIRDLARKAGVSTETVARFEAGEELKPVTVAAIRQALDTAGVEFIAESGGGAGGRLKKRGEHVEG